MSQSFSFPPPPPPPPVVSQNDYNPQQYSRDGYRGRGNQSHTQNGRGRGQHHNRGGQRGGYGRGNGQYHSRGGHAHEPQTHRDPGSQFPPPKFDAGQKRKHATAFQNAPNQALRNSRPLAPPAVPSFGVDFSALLPKKPETESIQISAQPKKTNLLGLTPTARNDDSEEDDEDEEAKLTAPAFTLNTLQFEHRGQTSTLRTPEEIAAWIAERRKHWPTEAKREVAQKEATDRAKKQEQEKAARLEASKAAAKTRQEEWQKRKLEKEKSQLRQKMLKEQIHKAKTDATESSTPLNAAQIKAERLRRKAEKVAQQLKVAEAQLEKQGSNKDAADDADLEALLTQVDRAAAVRSHGEDADVDAIESASEDSDISSTQGDTLMADDTSTSGTSDLDSGESDSDAPPEELTSKHAPSANAPPPARRASLDASTDTRPLCTNFAKAGRCKFGRKCRFRHPKPDKKAFAAQQSGVGNRRKGLYQVMVEKEQEEEQKRVLRAIIALGDAGLLNEEETSKSS